MWHELRDNEEKLLARYDPARQLLEIVRRGVPTLFDLTNYQQEQSPPESTPTLQPPPQPVASC